ncbi:MAG: hypothetical protein IJ223_00485 [Clostridia bacterium]|nr:hypothetical protein [Clostridia bacterium]
MTKLKIILVLLIIFVAGLLGYMLLFIPSTPTYTYDEYKKMQEENAPEFEKTSQIRIFPENREFFEYRYEGELDINYLYEKLYDLVHKNLPLLQKDITGLSSVELYNYLANNEANLIAMMGITEIEQLIELQKNIFGKNIDDSEYLSTELITDTFFANDDYDKMTFKIKYKNAELYFKTRIAKEVATSPMIIIESIENVEVY